MLRKTMLLVVFAAAVVAWPSAGSSAAPRQGVVVGTMHGSVLVASPTGIVTALGGHASIGSRVVFSDGRLTVIGRARSARIHGIVVRRLGTTMFLSSNKHLVAVHSARRLASAGDSPTTAPVGDTVNAQVTITSNGQLDEENEDDLGPGGSTNLQVQAVVASIGTGTVTLTVNGQPLTIPLPSGLTLPASLVGQTVTLNLSLGGQNGQGNQIEGDDQGDDDGGGD